MRITITKDPFADYTPAEFKPGQWPAEWVTDGRSVQGQPQVMAFRRRFSLAEKTTLRLHVTADERYELFLDGERLGRGPERGSPLNWFFETYEVNLSPGEHVLVARVWWLGGDGWLSPFAQMTIRPGFLLAEDLGRACEERLNTGQAGWESKPLGGYSWVDPAMAWGAGAKVHLRGAELDWDWQTGEGEGWKPVTILGPGMGQSAEDSTPPWWRLRPAVLPPMLEEYRSVGQARHVQALDSEDTEKLVVRAEDHLPAEAEAWNALLRGDQALTIPPRTRRRVIVDLGDYYCGYPEIVTSDGVGARLRVWWAESLFQDTQRREKGNRDEIEGKVFLGNGDTFEPNGGEGRLWSTLWWEAGRYLEVVVSTEEEPLTLERWGLRETRYPHQWEGDFEASDPRLGEVAPIMRRTLEMCTHETYMDCPYYEQMMYIGDTRLQVLVTYMLTHDERLPRKALLMFDESRDASGLTQSRYPARWSQVITPFSLWWVAMVHDYAYWRDDPEFVAARMLGVRSVLDAYRQRINEAELLGPMPGWSFVDWVPQWERGIPPDAHTGVSGVINWQFVLVLRLGAELEELAGEPLLARRNRETADRVASAAREAFWDEGRGLLADDLSHQHFSEHAQCLALLAEAADPAGVGLEPARRERIVQGLLEGSDLARTTIYFSHYLFEAYRLLGRMDRLLERMRTWFDLPGQGFRTTLEHGEPSRSDCHAWGAHPLFHYRATILGVRPAAPGFRRVHLAPQLGPLEWARARVPHPRGEIGANLRVEGQRLTGEIVLPEGVSGELIWGAEKQELSPGRQKV
ncbi:MAG: alpha-L-rhamnosidase [candidate division WS1 bacterium]|nr:alpha-L-rhamnosidase [candidate division WS1 bacterium]